MLCSPSTHLIASEILLFPDPFGPITLVIPGISSNIVLSAKDLNPCNSNLFKYIFSPRDKGTFLLFPFFEGIWDSPFHFSQVLFFYILLYKTIKSKKIFLAFCFISNSIIRPHHLKKSLDTNSLLEYTRHIK